LLCAAPALAAEGQAFEWKNFIFRVVNCILVVGIVWYAAGRKIAAFFANRRRDIVDDFSNYETRRKDAQKELADVEQRIADLEAERKAILDEYRAQGELLKAEIIAKAEKAAAQIAEQARRTAENEANLALEGIRAQIAEEIAEAAGKLLRERLSEVEHGRLIDAALEKVVLN
jgi:F-type H+-transporting ATPase subunit b